MRATLLVSLMLLFTFSGSADVSHIIDVGVENASLETRVELDCDGRCPGGLSWNLPDNGQLEQVEAVNADIRGKDHVNGDSMDLDFSPDIGTDKVVVLMDFSISKPAEEIHDGLYRREFSLPSFSNEETTGEVGADNLLSGKPGYGFETSYGNESMSFQGEGPAYIRIKFGDGEETGYFEYFGDNRGEMQDAYEIPRGMTGLQQDFSRFPVAVIPDEKYNRTLNRWSAGEYFDGVIRLRQSLDDREFKPVLAHEVVHGLNDRKLNWDSTDSSYIDEGTSRFVDHLVRKKMYREGKTDKKPRELFGESVRWDPEKGDGYYRELPSRGSRDRLWLYYSNGRDLMKEWNPQESPEEWRSFGYAYSELIVRYHVMQNNSMSEIYGIVNTENEVEDADRKWDLYADEMEMEPCKYENRSRFERCLNRVQEYDYSIYSAKPDRNHSAPQIKKVQVPEREDESNVTDQLGTVEEVTGNLLERLIRSITQILGELTG